MKKKFKLIRDKKLQSKRFALNSNKNRVIIDIKNMEIAIKLADLFDEEKTGTFALNLNIEKYVQD